MTRARVLLLSLCSAAPLLAACSVPILVGRHPGPRATATLRDSAGKSIGDLALERTADGVRIRGDLRGLRPGPHGIHFHAVGQCDAPAFTTAGGHFNPAGMKHGLDNTAGPHAGDLPAVTVRESGRVSVDLTTPRVTLDSAAANTVFDADGTALVLHAGDDDQRTDPSGNSGARIACGVVKRK